MKKLFIFHDYSENMKAKITNFNLKGKKISHVKMLRMLEALEKRSLFGMSMRNSSGRSTCLRDIMIQGPMSSMILG